MPKDEQKDSSANNKQPNSYLKFTGIAFQMMAVIGIFAYAGVKIDHAEGHTTQWVTALLSLIGVFIAMYIIIKSLKN
jgi:F0F1-type ATP synthase assembly protein I